MRKSGKRSGIIAGVLLPMAIVCLFAVGALALALFGGRAYKAIQNYTSADFETTVTTNYLRTKISQNNKKDAVAIETIDGVQVLLIDVPTESGTYQTRIFVYNGEMMESFTAKEKVFDPADATVISKVAACEFSISENGLFVAEIESEDGTHTRVAFALAGRDAL